ncbi:hypothetical protein I3255_03900 [Psychrobacter sp. Ps6]|nr:hypothetical protein [Psychrobacter sp. Ps6]
MFHVSQQFLDCSKQHRTAKITIAKRKATTGICLKYANLRP